MSMSSVKLEAEKHKNEREVLEKQLNSLHADGDKYKSQSIDDKNCLNIKNKVIVPPLNLRSINVK